jgi:GTPase SAR1 family protein
MDVVEIDSFFKIIFKIMVDSKAGADGMVSYKVVMLGESGVGKTCIVNKYIKGTFN